jgi:hypothetical protein
MFHVSTLLSSRIARHIYVGSEHPMEAVFLDIYTIALGIPTPLYIHCMYSPISVTCRFGSNNLTAGWG